MYCFPLTELQRKTRYAAAVFGVFFSVLEQQSLMGKQSGPARFTPESEAVTGAPGLTFFTQASLIIGVWQ